MDRRLVVLGLGALALPEAQASPATASESAVKALYARFVDAQNRRDTAAVRVLLLDSPRFLWVSDGKPFWGPETMIERMSAFQKAEIWEVTPALDRARVIDVAPDAAFLFQPLTLRLGPKGNPNSIDFLVNVLTVRQSGEWRIAALFTTEENPK
ncbi:nuclear transport factor 2 family protein [Rhabdaerophilum sp. SD176]|jgi:ketosteroid isomerase-like protein|uniref:nuclear transport factor 2 family protein n=1 Tax=Rhabdaerophilum sp. SD176 TaxID=2983548 RepID=UPI0024DFEB0A|nr:nuclear transport factor 2 family protein [Rhabdaerophilum sp. SD176]